MSANPNIWKFTLFQDQITVEPGPGFSEVIRDHAAILSEKILECEEVALVSEMSTESVIRLQQVCKDELMKRGYKL